MRTVIWPSYACPSYSPSGSGSAFRARRRVQRWPVASAAWRASVYTVPRKSFVLFLQENEAFFVIDRPPFFLIYSFTALLLASLLTSPLIIPACSTSFLHILPIT